MLVLVALLPLVVIVSIKLIRWTGDTVLAFYGIGVITSTIFVIYLATMYYADPATTAPRSQSGSGARSGPPGAALPLVSCMVAVYNEVDNITACVSSLLGSDYPALEVIVVDDGSTDGSRDLLQAMSTEGSFQYLPLEQNAGKKRALLAACRHARGEFLVFTDSDCVLEPDAIRRCVEAMLADDRLGAVSGHARALNARQNPLTRAQDVWYDGQFSILKGAEAVFGSVTCVSGPLAVFRREAVWNFLPAWANDRFVGREFRFATDRQLTGQVLVGKWAGQKAKARFPDDPFVSDVDYPVREWNVGYVRSARVYTNVPVTLRAFFRQQTRWKKSFVRSLFFTGRYYWRRGPLPAAMYYGHVLWVLVAPAMAFRHIIWLPLHGLWFLSLLYFTGVTVKGLVWGAVFKLQHPHESTWFYRPIMSLMSAVVLAWLLPYAILTLRRATWARGLR